MTSRYRSVLFSLFLVTLSTSASAAALCQAPPPSALKGLNAAIKKDAAAQSRAMPIVHAEGTLPHQGIYDQSREAQKDWVVVFNAAMLWRGEHKPEDLTLASRLLADWAKVYRPSFNPIDETGLDRYIAAFDLIRDDLDPQVRKSAGDFIQALTTGYLQRMERDFRADKGTWVNNWNSHRVKLVTMGAAVLQDGHLWDRARQQFIAQLGHNIQKDGSVMDFHERDALHYVVYDLEPLTTAAMVAKGRGEDWLHLNKQGVSIAHALDWLVPYATGQQAHEEFVNSKVKFDAARRNAGMSGFGGPWDRKGAAALFGMAAQLDPRYRPVADSLGPSKGWTSLCFGG
ncbi:alginate lyase family protein [Rhizobium oryzicola]|uniref:Alginate lyase family protein n=1 Tax=Rhizobium oryzicola TaxID=1232668 RepID=A0ABT8ST58_9HYPH|nr:alginate lyase family protein [Rhizobium oryzicola]MDO1581592.1 alginate lyase family protein [Rhizobium oryzicola]